MNERLGNAMADIFDAYIAKSEDRNPDGSGKEDLDRDLFEPIARLVSADCAESCAKVCDAFGADAAAMTIRFQHGLVKGS